MAAERAVLIAIIILALAVSPLAVPLMGGSSPGDATAYAALVGGGRSPEDLNAPAMQDDDDDDNENNNDGGGDDDGGDDNDNDDGDDDDDDNDNDDGDDDDDNDNDDGDDDDDNDNDDGDDDDDNDNGDGVVRQVVIRRDPKESVNRPTKCFDTREVGVVQLGQSTYDVTVTVMPHSSLNQTTRLTLRDLDSPPAISGGTLVDSVYFQLDAQSSCDGAAIGQLPNWVNMGIIYNVTNAVDKSKLQIVRLEGGSWVNVDTVPDPVPGNPYVSTTINMAGTYALIQKP